MNSLRTPSHGGRLTFSTGAPQKGASKKKSSEKARDAAFFGKESSLLKSGKMEDKPLMPGGILAVLTAYLSKTEEKRR